MPVPGADFLRTSYPVPPSRFLWRPIEASIGSVNPHAVIAPPSGQGSKRNRRDSCHLRSRESAATTAGRNPDVVGVPLFPAAWSYA